MSEWVHIDLFSGIGGMHLGLLNAGFKFSHHYFSEIDKHAIANYKYNFPNAEHIGSVTNVSGHEIRAKHPNAKIIITFGWPCQDNSIAGKRKGQRAGTRSGLLFEAGRIINECKPQTFIAENVKGLYSVMEETTSTKQLDFLPTLIQVVHNTQLRCSFLIQVGYSLKIERELTLSDILEQEVSKEYFLSQKTIAGLLKGQATPQLLEP